jgi:hypothetical protein
MSDAVIRQSTGAIPVPEFAGTAFTAPPPLERATVAIVTTAGLQRPGEEIWKRGEESFRIFGREERDLTSSHLSNNWDRSGFVADLDVVYPIDRLDADGIPRAVEAFVRIADGTPWKEVGLDGHPLQWSRDVTSYFEEAAAALAGHVPAARSAESWLYQKTETGRVLKQARARLEEAGEAFWFYLIPFTQDL